MNFLEKIIKTISLAVLIGIILPGVTSAQMGFGCLGLSGFYAGYSQYSYKADGLNETMLQLNPGTDLTKNDLEFKQGTGYRIGANFFRAKFSSVFFTAKGYYQFLKETKDVVTTTVDGLTKNSYELSMNHWGIGLDMGFAVLGVIDLKLIEGGVNFYNDEFTSLSFAADNTQIENKFTPADVQIGYYVGSGLILHLIPDYISIEGTAFYTFTHVDNMKDGSGITIPGLSINNKLITKGGFSATVQLNVGFPL